MIDTGASITILANDILKGNINILNYIVKLYGIVEGVSVQSTGLVQGVVEMDDCFLGTAFHLVDRKHAGPADGYLGYDFLMPYKTIINMNKMTLQFDFDGIIKTDTDTNDQNDFQNSNENGPTNEPMGAHSGINDNFKMNGSKHSSKTDFNHGNLVGNNPRENIISKDEVYDDYANAVNFYEEKFDEFESYKVHTTNSAILNERNTFATHMETPSYGYDELRENTDNCRSHYIMNKLNIEHCIGEEKAFIKKICKDFPYQFHIDGDMVGTTNVMKHRIKIIPGSKVVNIRQYRIPHTHKKFLEKIVNEFEEQGIIEKCESNYNSPVVLVSKRDDFGGKTDFRFVVDYRKINEITEIENFPIPLIDDILDGLNGSVYFTTLDLKGAFYHIELDEESKNCTTFTAGNFKYRWKKMPMGLASAPLTWQRVVNTIFGKRIGNGLYVYLDDLIVYGKTRQEHDRALCEVMKLLNQNNLQLKISKCIFFAREFEYLGHVITRDGIKANPKKIVTIKEYPRPTNVKKLQSFLGLCAYFRRYVNNFAKIAKPLTTLLKKDTPFVWTNTQQDSFDKLKSALANEVTLAFPNFDELFYVTTDASDMAIGAMLSQGELPNDRPIYFYSKTLNDTQKRYSTIEKELLAIVEAIKAFRVYLYGRFFILITDHKALCYLFNMKNCGSRLFRHKLDLLDYNFKILYRPGAQNHVADALSRIDPLSVDEVLEVENRKTSANY